MRVVKLTKWATGKHKYPEVLLFWRHARMCEAEHDGGALVASEGVKSGQSAVWIQQEGTAHPAESLRPTFDR